MVVGPAQAAPAEQKSNESVKHSEPAKADPAPIPDGGAFPFPNDAGGKALAKALTPALPRLAEPTGPRERQAPAFVTAPAPPPAVSALPPPRLAVAAAKDVRPTPLPDRVPPDLGGTFPQLPPRSELPSGALIRVEGRDPSKPAELPLLSSKPVPDRASLADPTVEFTARSVISIVLPLRADPAGFVRINLPDPFEHAAAAKPRPRFRKTRTGRLAVRHRRSGEMG